MKDAQLLNFAYHNTIVTFSKSVNDLITDLHKESKKAIDWFYSNKMVVNLSISNRLRKIKGLLQTSN